MFNSLDVVIRLQTWTILRRKGRFYITTEERATAHGKSYKTLRHAATAIGRKIEEEFTRRSERIGR